MSELALLPSRCTATSVRTSAATVPDRLRALRLVAPVYAPLRLARLRELHRPGTGSSAGITPAPAPPHG